MRYTKLGQSDLNVSLLGYGAWALGKKGWPGVDEQEAVRTIELALNHGVNFFDTAPVYGFGRSEEMLGEVLNAVRKSVILATKCGLRRDDRGRVFHDLSRDAIYKDIEGSLKRLKTDYIDLYQIHWPDKKRPLEETFKTLNSLREQNIIRYIGVCNFNIVLLKHAMTLGEIISIQNVYNMLQKDVETEHLPFCRTQELGFICYSPLAQGILAGGITDGFKPGKHDIRRLNPLFRNKIKLLECIAFTRTLPHPPASAALSFLARQQGVSSILVSMTRRTHLLENIRALI